MSKWWRSAAGILKSASELRPCRPFHTIQAVPREISGPRISTRDRAQGRIPTVVFSQNYKQTNPNDPTSLVASASVSRKILLTTERKQIKAILKHIKLPFFCSTTFPLQIRAGSGSSTILETKRVLPIKIHMDGDGNVLNLVFVWAEDGTELKVDLPIVYKGEDVCPGLKKVNLDCLHSFDADCLDLTKCSEPSLSWPSGNFLHVTPVLLKEAEAFCGRTRRSYRCQDLEIFSVFIKIPEEYSALFMLPASCHTKTGGSLNQIRTSLKYLCPANQIPSKIEVDLSNLDIGDRVSIHDVVVHPSLKLLSKNETMPVCKIMATNIKNMEFA